MNGVLQRVFTRLADLSFSPRPPLNEPRTAPTRRHNLPGSEEAHSVRTIRVPVGLEGRVVGAPLPDRLPGHPRSLSYLSDGVRCLSGGSAMGISRIAVVLLMGWVSSSWAHTPGGLTLPSVSTGSVPYKSFNGLACTEPTDLLTVPSGQEFIITTVSSTANGSASVAGDWDGGTRLLKDDEVLLAGSVFSSTMSVSVSSGNGRLPVEAGARLSIHTTASSGCGYYFLQGYLIESGSPYRAYFGSSVDRTVMTVDPEKSFLVRTIALSTRESPSHCHVWVDGERVIHGESFLVHDRGSYDGGNPGPFPLGKGALLLTSGQSLQVGPEDASTSTQCDYYIEGEYIMP